MKGNMGLIDRIARITVGYLVVSMFFLIESDARWFALLGLIPVLTGLAGTCPVYRPFGIDTR